MGGPEPSQHRESVDSLICRGHFNTEHRRIIMIYRAGILVRVHFHSIFQDVSKAVHFERECYLHIIDVIDERSILRIFDTCRDIIVYQNYMTYELEYTCMQCCT